MHRSPTAAPLDASRSGLGALHEPGSLWWILRLACAMCYVGHGAFGIIGKEEWIPFFALAGISAEWARSLMPVIGLIDITVGISVLLAPRRAVLAYMVVWAVWTAALRPLTGEPVFELLERAGNYGVPLAFLLLLGVGRTAREWFGAPTLDAITPAREAAAGRVLTWTTALLLIGHGGLAAIVQKPLLAEHVTAVGLPSTAAVAMGWIEMAMALVVLAHPRVSVLLIIAGWKLATELLYPMAGAPIWEVIERGGSYGAPLALAVLVHRRAACAGGARIASASGRIRATVTRAVLGLAAVTCMAVPLAAQESGMPARLTGPALADSLRAGGYVLLFRHTETDHDAHDRGSARAEQRNLTSEGERHARELGEAFRELRIPVGEIRASYMYRTMETAQLAFGRVEADSTLRGQAARESIRAQASAPVARGTNRVLLGHNGTMSTVLEGHGVRRIAEGDIVVVEPLGESGFRVVAHITRADWAHMRGR